MKQVLGRKQNLKPDDEKMWWRVIHHIEDYITEKEVAEKTRETVSRASKLFSGKSVGYSWSGGKDSLVLAHIMQSMGITKSQCLITDLEYPAWRKWMENNAPENCKMVYVGYGLDFLSAHPELIFAKGKTKQTWNRLVQRSHFISFCKQEGLDICCIGHRQIDGNFTGKNGIVQRPSGEILYAPLYDWSHEELFGYMHYHNLELPFIYRWYRGFYQGTHWWPYRYADTVEQGYKEVFDIDPTVVYEAAEKIQSAKDFINRYAQS